MGRGFRLRQTWNLKGQAPQAQHVVDVFLKRQQREIKELDQKKVGEQKNMAKLFFWHFIVKQFQQKL